MGELPADESALMQTVLNDPEAKYNSADLNVAYKMPVAEYQRLCPYAEALEENWGKPPGARLAVIRAIPHAPVEGCAETPSNRRCLTAVGARRHVVLPCGLLGLPTRCCGCADCCDCAAQAS